MNETRIVCAAVRTGEHIICGVRHFDEIMRKQVEAAGLRLHDFEQGFVDNRRNFLTRQEAYQIATTNGQANIKVMRSRKHLNKPELFSEDLY